MKECSIGKTLDCIEENLYIGYINSFGLTVIGKERLSGMKMKAKESNYLIQDISKEQVIEQEQATNKAGYKQLVTKITVYDGGDRGGEEEENTRNISQTEPNQTEPSPNRMF